MGSVGKLEKLWRIEETFKVTKSELDDRPVYVSTKEHIEAHFFLKGLNND